MDASFPTSDGCTIAYTLYPSASPHRVAFIHSLALDRSVWNGVVEQLAPHASVLVYDCRGHGQSARGTAGFTMERFAQDLAELLAHVGWPSAAIAGCSMGGGVAQAFAGLYPDRTDALALIDTTAWYGAEAPVQWRERATAAKAKGLAGMVDFQTTRWFGDAFRQSNPELVKAATTVFFANDLDCYASACEMLGDSDLRHYLPAFRMPVAIVVGEEDYATPVASARQLHDALPGSTLTILKGRHLTPIECPAQIAGELRTLLERVAAR